MTRFGIRERSTLRADGRARSCVGGSPIGPASGPLAVSSDMAGTPAVIIIARRRSRFRQTEHGDWPDPSSHSSDLEGRCCTRKTDVSPHHILSFKIPLYFPHERTKLI